MAATIVECALAAAPRSVEHINKAMRRALGEKAVSVAGKVTAGDSAAASRGAAPASETGGKESRAEPVKPVASQDGEPNDFFEFFGIGVGGIYLSTPGSTWFHACDPDDPCCSGELTPACLRP